MGLSFVAAVKKETVHACVVGSVLSARIKATAFWNERPTNDFLFTLRMISPTCILACCAAAPPGLHARDVDRE